MHTMKQHEPTGGSELRGIPCFYGTVYTERVTLCRDLCRSFFQYEQRTEG